MTNAQRIAELEAQVAALVAAHAATEQKLGEVERRCALLLRAASGDAGATGHVAALGAA